MDGKKGIRTAILAYLIVGCVGLGFGVFAHAQELDDNLLSALVSSKSQTEEEPDKTEASEEETSVDESTESGDELEALLEEAHAEEENSTREKLTEDELASQDTSSEEDLSDEEDALKEEAEEESAAYLREGPYYQYTIVSDFDLNMYNAQDTPTGSGVIGVIPKGTTGYAIEQGSRRTLIEYEGNYAYVSNTYTQLSEVSADEYPNELKNITMENVVISE